MADFIIGRGVWYGFILLALPALFLYHELAVQNGWPLLIASFPGLYPVSSGDTIMFIGNAFLLPLGAAGLGISLLRSYGSRLLGGLMILSAVVLGVAIVVFRPGLHV
jgi:hypothetical protein